MRLGVGLVGYSFMGAAHSQAWRTVNRVFDLPAQADLTALCGRNPEAVQQAATAMGWSSTETDWRALLKRDDVSVVDVCTPGNSHAEISIAALDAGKHVLCEKPLANSVPEARAMVAAAQRAQARGVRSMVGFNYRRVPAVSFMRQLIADGRLGTIRHVRATYLQDWIIDPDFPLTWRLQAEQAGSGALGDLGAHIVDMAQYVTGARITGVSALTETFIGERPLPEAASGLAGTGTSDSRGPVTVDDAALFLARLDGGAVATFEATRFAQGRKNGLHLEINGDGGSAGVRPRAAQRAGVLRRLARPGRGRLPAHPGDRAEPPLPRRVVAAGPHPRLRTQLHPRDARLPRRHRRERRPGAQLRRRPTGAAGARRRRPQRRGRVGVDDRRHAMTYKRPQPSTWELTR